MKWFVTFSFFRVYYRLACSMFLFVAIELLTDAFDGKFTEIISTVNPSQNTIQKKNGIKDERICYSSFNNVCTKTRVDLKELFWPYWELFRATKISTSFESWCNKQILNPPWSNNLAWNVFNRSGRRMEPHCRYELSFFICTVFWYWKW